MHIYVYIQPYIQQVWGYSRKTKPSETRKFVILLQDVLYIPVYSNTRNELM
jgi:hypothetical protein